MQDNRIIYLAGIPFFKVNAGDGYFINITQITSFNEDTVEDIYNLQVWVYLSDGRYYLLEKEDAQEFVSWVKQAAKE